MSVPHNPASADPIDAAYQEGRRWGLATAALALSVIAFVNLLGFEKSMLAGVLALLSLQGAAPVARILRRGRRHFCMGISSSRRSVRGDGH